MKKEIEKILDDWTYSQADEATASIEIEEFGSSTTYQTSLETMIELIDEVNTILGNKTMLEELFAPLTIELIEAQLESVGLHNFEELKEIESSKDADREDKYIYISYIMLHTPSGKHYEFEEQTCRRTEETGSITLIGEVEKTEKTVITWGLK